MRKFLVAFLIIALLGSICGIAYLLIDNSRSPDLESDYAILMSEYQTLKDNYDDLNNEYQLLEDDYNALNSQYQVLKADYDALKTAYEDLLNATEPWQEIDVEVVGKVDIETLNLFLMEYYPSPCYRMPLDEEYTLVSLSTLEQFLALDDTDHNSDPKELGIYDCDDFAIRLRGNWIKAGFAGVPLGIAAGNRGGVHAFNIFVTMENSELVLYEIEPQNDGITRIDNPEEVPATYIYII